MAFSEKIIVYIIITLVLIGGTMFGMSTSDKIQKKQRIVILNKFLLDMDKHIDQTKDNYGKVVIGEFKLPEDALKICFIDLKNPSTDLSGLNSTLIENSVSSGVNKNMFVMSKKEEFEPFYNQFLRLKNKTICFENPKDNYITIRFTGVGNATQIELN